MDVLMKQVKGVWLPNKDTHFRRSIDSHGRYQRTAFNRLMDHTSDRGVFLDVGAHVGLWAKQAIEKGFSVIAFEPLEAHAECFKKNVPEATLVPAVVGCTGYCKMVAYDGNSGAAHAKKTNDGIKIYALDDLLGNIENVSAIKIDVEGMEVDVLMGAKELIQRNRPTLIIEQKSNMEGLIYAQQLGMTVLDNFREDYILGWR